MQMWDCACGRRVPGHVDTCRCGRPRPAAPAAREATPRAAAPPPPSAPASSIYQSTGLRAVGAFGVMILVYFGSRACNRDVVSRDVRQQAQEVLTRSIGAEHAKTAMNRFHRACFDETYRTGWGRRQASKFDEEKYVGCLGDRIRKDREFAGGATPGRARRSASDPIPTRVAGPGPPRLALERITTDPNTRMHSIELSVSGGALPAMVFTNVQVICDGVPIWKQPGHPTIHFGYNDDPSRTVVGALGKPGAQSCVYEIALANPKMQPISETLRVTLPGDGAVPPVG